ncbi:Fc.00g029470.m01.CDS01 [Cosmosporella sp. VM-42]
MDPEYSSTISLDSFPDETSQQPSQEQPPDKPYHSKRPHKKSRAGCKNCKTRKVKCDEARPVCRSCKLRKVECVYPNPPSSSSSQPPPSPSGSTASTATIYESPESYSPGTLVSRGQSPLVVSEPMFRPPNVDAVDMKLLWFYTTATASSFSVDAGGPNPVDNILKVKMVQVAFNIPFLMDSLFALSCLHLQSLDQDCDPGRALAYRARSFEGYRRAVEEAKPETFPALIANSLFLTALSSQVFREDETKELYIIDWMIVWRGIGLMVEMMGVDSLFNSGMSELFYRPPIDLEKAAAAIPNYLLFMVSSIKPDDIDYPHVDTYYDTLKYLGSLYSNLKEGLGPIMNLRIITWFTFLPREFVQLSRERRPRALVIIAHYVAFIKVVQGVWWLEGVGDRSLDDITKYLGTEWHHLFAVPRMARNVQGELPVSRIILEDRSWEPPKPKSLFFDSNAPIALVDDEGRRVEWTPNDKKLVVLDSNTPGQAGQPAYWHKR